MREEGGERRDVGVGGQEEEGGWREEGGGNPKGSPRMEHVRWRMQGESAVSFWK